MALRARLNTSDIISHPRTDDFVECRPRASIDGGLRGAHPIADLIGRWENIPRLRPVGGLNLCGSVVVGHAFDFGLCHVGLDLCPESKIQESRKGVRIKTSHPDIT